MAFKIVFTPHPILAYEKRRKERFAGFKGVLLSRKNAEATVELLQRKGATNGIYKIVPADYQLRDV